MIYNPLDRYYKSYTGAVPEKEKITFRVKGNFDSVIFALKKDGEEKINFYSMIKDGDSFIIDFKFDVGLYFYFFKIGEGQFISQNKDFLGVITPDIKAFQLTVYSKEFKVPEWFSGGIMYQIFPDRFFVVDCENEIANGKILHKSWDEQPIYLPNENGKILNNDFFGGNLKGIKSKLSYLNELGVSVLYLNPIFEAYSNHRYDTGNYMKIDCVLGDEQDLIDLINEAEEFGIKIILDGVFNHTGDDSLYFNKYGNYNSVGAYQSKDSPYANWYNFLDYPDEYDSWWGIKTLPSINEKNEDFSNFIAGNDGVINHYSKMGIGGWRLDVVDELPSSFVKKIRQAVKNVNDEGLIIGEVWEDASNKISYGKRRSYFQGEELDSVMNYPLKNAIIDYVNFKDSTKLIRTIREQIDHYPKNVLNSLMNLLSTHDTMRLINAVSGVNVDGKSKNQLANLKIERNDKLYFNVKVASLLQYTLCGVPCVYYGDEVGMDGWFDPLNRRTYPWGKEDKELQDWYKKLGEIRRSISAFKNGDFIELHSGDSAFIFKRVDEQSQVLIVLNVGYDKYQLEFDGQLENLIDENKYENTFEVTPLSFAILIKPA